MSPQVLYSVHEDTCEICKRTEGMLASCHSRSVTARPLTGEGKCRSIYLFRPSCAAISAQSYTSNVLVTNLIFEYTHSFCRARKSSKWKQRTIFAHVLQNINANTKFKPSQTTEDLQTTVDWIRHIYGLLCIPWIGSASAPDDPRCSWLTLLHATWFH